MEVSVTKKTNRYAALATYLVAIVCLLLGLFLPLFDGKGILALQLPQALNSLANKEILKFGKDFTLAYPVAFFGKGKAFDFMALCLLLYAAVTVLGLLALIPIGISVKKDGKSYAAFMRIIETAAVLVLTLYFLIVLQYATVKVSYNLVIAVSGALLTLIILCFMTKGKTGAAKFFLLLFSAIALLSLFNFVALIPKLEEPLLKFTDKLKLGPLFLGSNESRITGISYLAILFEGLKVPLISVPENPQIGVSTYFDIFKNTTSAADKTAMMLVTIIALLAVVNFFIDVIALSTNGKRVGLLFNIVRYGIEILAVIALIITALAAKYTIGIMLILLGIAVLIQVLISVLRYVYARKRAASLAAEEAEETITFVKPPRRVKQIETNEEIIIERTPVVEVSEPKRVNDNSARPAVVDMEVVEKPVKASEPEPRAEVIEEPEQQTIDTVLNEKQSVTEEQNVAAETAEPEVKKDEPETVREVKAEPVQEVKEVKTEPAPIREVKVERVQEVKEVKPQPEPVREVKAEPVQEVKETKPEPSPVHSASGNVYIVGQSSDEFIKKLTNEEKLEFTRTFIEKLNGSLGSVPDYIIGGDNKKFFSSVFIYLGRLRGMISDNLLNKMYKELNML